MKKPLVGILGHVVGDAYGQNAPYIEFARDFGNVIILDAGMEEPMEDLDILILPGGRDVSPIRYGKRPYLTTQNPDIQYEYFYQEVFPKYMPQIEARKTVVVGICAGFQNLNVIFGGGLNQHIGQSYSKTRDELVDTLKMIRETQFCDIPQHYFSGNKKAGGTVLKNKWRLVNSLHHQGVYDETYSSRYVHTLSPEFLTLSYNLVMGNVESFRHKTLPIIGFQYHPEEMVDNNFEKYLIQTMLEQTKENFSYVESSQASEIL